MRSNMLEHLLDHATAHVKAAKQIFLLLFPRLSAQLHIDKGQLDFITLNP